MVDVLRSRALQSSTPNVTAVAATASIRNVQWTVPTRVIGGILPLLAVPLPDEAQPLQGQERIDAPNCAGMRRNQVGQAACRDGGGLGAELPPDVLDDAVHLAGEAVDDTRLEGGDRRLADHGLRFDEVDLAQARRASEERVHRGLDAGG